jgi:hypothetical protein
MIQSSSLHDGEIADIASSSQKKLNAPGSSNVEVAPPLKGSWKSNGSSIVLRRADGARNSDRDLQHGICHVNQW